MAPVTLIVLISVYFAAAQKSADEIVPEGGAALISSLDPAFSSPEEMECKRGGQWVRPYGNVAADAQGVVVCASHCGEGGYKYFGLECPGRLSGEDYPPAMVHCQCAHSLEGSSALEVSQCNSNNVGSNTHCVGPYTAGGYNLGSHGTGSVYLTNQLWAKPKAPPSPPVAAPGTGSGSAAVPTLSPEQLVKGLEGEDHDTPDEGHLDAAIHEVDADNVEGKGPYVWSDAHTDPVTKRYYLGSARRRIGAGFGPPPEAAPGPTPPPTHDILETPAPTPPTPAPTAPIIPPKPEGSECEPAPGQWVPIYCKVLHVKIEEALQGEYAEYWHEDYCSGLAKTTCPMACNPKCHDLQAGLPFLDHEKALFNEGAENVFGGRTCCQDDESKCLCCQNPDLDACRKEGVVDPKVVAFHEAMAKPGGDKEALCDVDPGNEAFCGTLGVLVNYMANVIDRLYEEFTGEKEEVTAELVQVRYGELLKNDIMQRVLNGTVKALMAGGEEHTLEMLKKAQAQTDPETGHLDIPIDVVNKWATFFGITPVEIKGLLAKVNVAHLMNDNELALLHLRAAAAKARGGYCHGAYSMLCPKTCIPACGAGPVTVEEAAESVEKHFGLATGSGSPPPAPTPTPTVDYQVKEAEIFHEGDTSPVPKEGVTFYKHCVSDGRYAQGYRVTIFHDTPNVGEVGMQNNDVSGIWIPHGWEVEIYDKFSYDGTVKKWDACESKSTHVACLVKHGFNDRMESVKISPCPNYELV